MSVSVCAAHPGRVRSALRRAAAGEQVAVLADRAQAEALAALPFAGELEIVARSPEVPASFVCQVGERLHPARLEVLRKAMLELHASDTGAELLESMRLERFAPLEDEAPGGAPR